MRDVIYRGATLFCCEKAASGQNNGVCRVQPTPISAGQFRSAGHCIGKSIGSQQPPTLCGFLQIRLLHHYFFQWG